MIALLTLMAALSFTQYSDIEVVAITIMGEAWGESYEGKRAVGQVILNRAKKRWRGAKTARHVCLDPKQFSSINTMTEAKIKRFQKDRSSWRRSLIIAEKVVRGMKVHEIKYIMFDNRLNRWYKKTGYKKIGNHYFW